MTRTQPLKVGQKVRVEWEDGRTFLLICVSTDNIIYGGTYPYQLIILKSSEYPVGSIYASLKSLDAYSMLATGTKIFQIRSGKKWCSVIARKPKPKSIDFWESYNGNSYYQYEKSFKTYAGYYTTV